MASVPYDISIEGVREVNLLGDADLDHWTRILAPEGLHPTVHEGRAEVLVGTFDSRWKGFRFQEAVVSVFTSDTPGGSGRDGIYLAQAFNSRRFFAWVERVLNRSPYVRAAIAPVCRGASSSMRIAVGDSLFIEAAMAGHTGPATTEDMVWEGPIHLPSPRPGERPGEMFLARLEGATHVFPFSPERDRLRLGDGVPEGVSRGLVASGFTGRAWWIREAGKHAKSKTLPRRALPGR